MGSRAIEHAEDVAHALRSLVRQLGETMRDQIRH
jgi:hypothetical protein